MNKILNHIVMLAIILIVASCTGKVIRKELDKDAADSVVEVKPQYAKGFTVRMLDNGIRLVDVKDPQKSKGMTYHFALVNQGMEATDIPEGYTRIDVPVRRTILMTMLQLSNFTILNAHDVVKGIPGTKNLFNKDILQRGKKGEIVKIGMEGNFDPELVMASAPEIIFISPFKRGGYDAIKETGVTLVPHLGYKELDPL